MSGGSEPRARSWIRHQRTRDSIDNRLVKKPPEDCICPICANLAMGAVIFSPCGHLLCRNCDERWERCPTCRQIRGGASAKAIRVRSKIQSLEVFCVKKYCNAVFPLGSLAKHQEQCLYMREICTFCKNGFQRCDWEIPRSHRTCCPLRLILERESNMKERVSMIETANKALESQVQQLRDECNVWRWRCDVSNLLLRENRCKRLTSEKRKEGEIKRSNSVENDAEEKSIVLDCTSSGDVSDHRYGEEGQVGEQSAICQSELTI